MSPWGSRTAVPTAPLRRTTSLIAIALLAGCATAPPGTVAPIDPWENFNRKVYSFNDVLDRKILKPVAETYRDVVPSLVRTGVSNVLGNIYDVWSAANHLLQGKVHTGLDMGMRVLTNTIFGLGGLLDPATEMGLVRRSEDFGQTLGHWGVPNGPYLVLPLFGPSTVRDTAGLIVDRQVAPSTLPDTRLGEYAVAGTDLINTRARLLQTGDLIDQVALDRYVFIRDAYLARRRDDVYDGAPPMETFADDGDDFAAPAAGASGAGAPSAAASAARSAGPAASAAQSSAPAAEALPASGPSK